MNRPGPCSCPCGWTASGALRVDWYPEALSVTTDDGPDDPTACPECGLDLWAEDMNPRSGDPVRDLLEMRYETSLRLAAG